MGLLDNLFGGHHGGGHHGHHEHHQPEHHAPRYGGHGEAYGNRSPNFGGITCAGCNTLIAADAKFCQNCGKSTQPSRCTQCAATLVNGARFCGQCGKQAG